MAFATRLTDLPSRPRAALIALVALALGCGGGGAGPTLQSLTFASGKAYAIVGTQQQLVATGQYSDGTSSPVSSGLAWTSSDPTIASVDDKGLVTPWEKGDVQITVRHAQSGVSATVDLTARAVVALTAGKGLPASGRVDTDLAYFHVAGLTPGAMYLTSVSSLSDDVDLAVYSDVAMAPATRLCRSEMVGLGTEACVAPANAEGELWLAVDGQWTRSGASFSIDVAAAPPMQLVQTLAYPADLPYAGAVGATRQYLGLTGLTAGTTYDVKISNLSADIDLAVYADPYEYDSRCQSYQGGTVDELCTVASPASGELFVEIDGETSIAGGTYTLSVTPK